MVRLKHLGGEEDVCDTNIALHIPGRSQTPHGVCILFNCRFLPIFVFCQAPPRLDFKPMPLLVFIYSSHTFNEPCAVLALFLFYLIE